MTISEIDMTKVEQKLLIPSAYTSKTDIEKFYDSMRNAKAIRETKHECVELADGGVRVKEICEILKVVIVALACPFAVPFVSEIESEQSS